MRILLTFLLLLAGATTAEARSITGTEHWRGEMRLAESVRVEPGGHLVVEPGSRVVFEHGGLEVAGTLEARDASFAGERWSGLALKGNDATTLLEGVTVRGAKTGVFVGGGAPRLAGLVLTGNEVGMEIRQKSSAQVERCRFEGNSKVGLFVKDESTPQVRDCVFRGNGRFGAYIHHANPAVFSGHRFEKNDTGLAISNYGSDPTVRDCLFIDNPLGVLVDRAAAPSLTGNRWQDNAVGLKLHRRSDARVNGNRFEGNRLAVLVSFSSYPQITRNDFVANAMALRLEHQSATWEEERGAAARAGEVARLGAFGGQNSTRVDEEQRRARDLTGTVEARDNWWGEDGSRELEKLDAAGNPSFIDDGRDRPRFEDQGKSYPLDTVDYTPWRRRPVHEGGA